MGVKTTVINTNSVLDVLKALKGLLGTGWTLDEENVALWKDSPAAFPVGLIKGISGSSSYITVCCKDSAGNTVFVGNSSSFGYTVTSSVTDVRIWVFDSPNGSIAISLGEQNPIFGFIKNSNVDSSLPSYIPVCRKSGSYSYKYYYPGTNSSWLTNGFPIGVIGTSEVLINMVYPYTSNVLTDFYMLVSTCSDKPPLVLTNGSQKFIRFYYYNITSGAVYYMRYV